jgi:UDP-N-acetylglucosamine:LPS N-acetylglucosamine transferase
MLIVKPIPGQEANNTAFLTAKGAALKTDEPEEVGFIIQDLLSSPLKLKTMREAASGIAKPCASMDIARLLTGLNNG